MLINLPPATDIADLVRERAERQGDAAARAAKEEMLQWIQQVLDALGGEEARTAELDALTKRLLKKNAELYRRLA